MTRNPKLDPRPGDVLAIGGEVARRQRIEVVRVEPARVAGNDPEVFWRGLLGIGDGGCDLTWWSATARYWSVEHVHGEVSAEQMPLGPAGSRP